MTESIDAKIARLMALAQIMSELEYSLIAGGGGSANPQAEYNSSKSQLEAALRTELARPQEVTDAEAAHFMQVWFETGKYSEPAENRAKIAMQAVLNSRIAATSTEPADSAAVSVPHIQFMLSDELRPRTPTEKKAYLEGVRDGKMYAVRDGLAATLQAPTAQPVAPGWQCVPVVLPVITERHLNYRLSDHWYGCAQSVWDSLLETLAAATSMPPKEGV